MIRMACTVLNIGLGRAAGVPQWTKQCAALTGFLLGGVLGVC